MTPVGEIKTRAATIESLASGAAGQNILIWTALFDEGTTADARWCVLAIAQYRLAVQTQVSEIRVTLPHRRRYDYEQTRANRHHAHQP